MRALLLLPLMMACTPTYNVVGIDDTEVDDTEEQDWSAYEGASLRIVSPSSADFLPLGEDADFEAELLSVEGEPLEYDDIFWTSSVDEGWSGVGLQFEDDSLDVGIHDITAEVDLPSGDRLAHTIGGVLVQSPFAGTFTGLFAADITYDTYIITCAGTATLVVDPTARSRVARPSAWPASWGTTWSCPTSSTSRTTTASSAVPLPPTSSGGSRSTSTPRAPSPRMARWSCSSAGTSTTP